MHTINQNLAAKILFGLSILAAILLTGCAPEAQLPHDNGTDAVPFCQMQASPQNILYPDGIVRKSSVTACDDGCETFTSVSDETVTFGTCE